MYSPGIGGYSLCVRCPSIYAHKYMYIRTLHGGPMWQLFWGVVFVGGVLAFAIAVTKGETNENNRNAAWVMCVLIIVFGVLYATGTIDNRRPLPQPWQTR